MACAIEADPPASLAALSLAEAECRRCPLYRNATQAVPGEGSPLAPLMLVGEQPGDHEDRTGKPFVGPAGHLLDRALAEAGIDRRRAFVTNAVKHFKYEPRGKRRLHKRPNADEIEQCRWWLDREIALVRPAAIVALGATAARSLLRRVVTIGRERGVARRRDDGAALVVTIHPSMLLRLRDETEQRYEYERFVADLRLASQAK
ncbi:MAG TPA: UdgX family uracil-DNA binding protein [Stellaceae bacterium]|jgi:DNA polymerase